MHKAAKPCLLDPTREDVTETFGHIREEHTSCTIVLRHLAESFWGAHMRGVLIPGTVSELTIECSCVVNLLHGIINAISTEPVVVFSLLLCRDKAERGAVA